MEFIDYHVHSDNSFDGKSKILNFCNKAIDLGISEICFTEHFSVDPKDVSYNVLDYKKYSREIEECQDIFKGKLIVKKGLEIGEPHIPYLKEELKNQLKEMNLDFIIGSVHNINSLKLRSYMKDKKKKEIYKDYFNEIYELVKNADIDVVGHLDLMKRYAYKDFGKYDFNNYKDNIERIFKEVIRRNMGIEVNTSGLRDSVHESYPSVEIIKFYKELGGEIITIGSDSHNSEDIGSNYFCTIEMLKKCKIRHIYKYKNRKPEGVNIQ